MFRNFRAAFAALALVATTTPSHGFTWEIVDIEMADRTVQLRASEELSDPTFFQYDAVNGDGAWWEWTYLGNPTPRLYEFAVPEETREQWAASPTCNLTDGGVGGEWGALGPEDFCSRPYEDGYAVSIPCVYANWQFPEPQE